jgi:hypothetical protein
MGAALLIQSIGFKANQRFEVDQEWASSSLAQARGAIAQLDQTRFEAINEELCGEYSDLAAYRELLLSDVAAVEAALADQGRDADLMAGGAGVVLLISGGLSWGDPPTDLYESITRLRHAEVMPDARWPVKP